jgi:osmotically-inducible protein OsmY
MADYENRYGERRPWRDEDRWERERSDRDWGRRDVGARDYGNRDYGNRDYSGRDYGRPYQGSDYGGGYRGIEDRYASGYRSDYGREFGRGDYGRQDYGRDQGRQDQNRPDYGRSMLDDMRRYSGRDEGYGNYPRDYDSESHSRDYGARGSGYVGGYYGAGGGYFGTSPTYGASGYSGEGAWSGSSGRSGGGYGEYGGYGYAGGGRGERQRMDYGRDYGRGGRGDQRGWWDRTADEVRSWFGDDDAERRRDADERAGHRGRGPRGYARSDDRIREDVSDRLTDDPFIDASEIEVAVSRSEVTLSGTADSRSARRRAEDLAEAVSGVTHVQNNLRVRQTGGTYGTGMTSGTGATATSGASGSTGSATGATGTSTGSSTGTGSTGSTTTSGSSRSSS